MKKDMSYEKLRYEFYRVKRALEDTKSKYQKRDYQKYLKKLEKQISDYEIKYFGRLITK